MKSIGKTEKQVVEFLPSEQVEQQMFFSSLWEDEQPNWSLDDLRLDIALASPPNASSPSPLGEPSVLLNSLNEQPHKKVGPSACSAHQTPGTGEPREGVWRERTTWAHWSTPKDSYLINELYGLVKTQLSQIACWVGRTKLSLPIS